MKTNSEELVCVKKGKAMTLKEVFESLGLTTYELNVDMLDVHAVRDVIPYSACRSSSQTFCPSISIGVSPETRTHVITLRVIYTSI